MAVLSSMARRWNSLPSASTNFSIDTRTQSSFWKCSQKQDWRSYALGSRRLLRNRHGGEKRTSDAVSKRLVGKQNLSQLAINPDYLRTMKDSKNIRNAAAEARHAVVIGGGFIGMEVFRLRPSLRTHITARPAVTLMRLDRRPAIVDTMAGCVYKNQAARISKTGDHRRNDSGG
jgi:hypothetical protein